MTAPTPDAGATQQQGTVARLPQPVEPLANVNRSREGGSERRGSVPLDRNERVGPLPEWFVSEVRRRIDGDLLQNYPSVDELQAALVESTGLPPERLLVTPGADPVIKALYQSYVNRGDAVVMLDPSYAMYEVYARMFGARAVGVPFDRELTPDLDVLSESIVPGTPLILLANPNQPTGTVLGLDTLTEILGRAAENGTLVVVDEAYWLFSPVTALSLLEDWPNLLVIRSFSKAGLAGARVGFIAGSEEVIGTLFKVRSAAEVNAVGILCATILLERPDLADDYAAEVEAGRAVLIRRMQALGLDAVPTHANFTPIRIGDREPQELVAALKASGWLIRGAYETPGLVDTVRVTLGPPALMEEFCDVFEHVLRELEKR